MKAKKILLHSPLLKWYVEHGLVVTMIYRVVEFVPRPVFKSFEESCTKARRQGDQNDTSDLDSLKANQAKLTANAGFGGLIMDKTKHSSIIIVNNLKRARQLRNSPQFVSCTELGGGFYELEMKKKYITLDLPIHLGWVVLQLAKLLMLEFCYDFLDKFVSRDDYRHILTDTDSIYISMSGENLESVIKPEYKEKYLALIGGRHEEKYPLWLPRECCENHRKYDRRHPGIMKVEATGYHIIALSSKTYLLKQLVLNEAGEPEEKYKLSCKGVMKSRVEDPSSIFKEVLTEQKICEAVNMGIKLKDNRLCTYQQTRIGFGYVYWKRQVLNDGVSTIPLNITLSPWQKLEDRFVFAGYQHPLHMDFKCSILFEGHNFFSLSQLFLYRKCQFLDLFAIQTEILGCKWFDIRNIYKKIKHSDSWDSSKEDILLSLCLLKMRSIKEVRKVLYESSNMLIIFADSRDRYLGVGMLPSVVELVTSDQYRGRNTLGSIWTEIKNKYSTEIEKYDILARKCIKCDRRRSDVNIYNDLLLCSSCAHYVW